MRRAAIAAVLCAGVIGATAASAAFKTGGYTGSNAKGGGVRFTASKTAVTKFTMSVLLRCSNGKQASTTSTISRIPIRSGRFSSSGGGVAVKGSLNGSKASGTLSVTIPSLPTGRNCTSGSLTWKATRGGAGTGKGLVCAPVGNFNGGDLQVDMSCSGGEFDAFVVELPRTATRADTSTAHLHCLVGEQSGPGYNGPIANCSAQDGVKLKSGRVLIRFSDQATCADATKTKVTALVLGDAEYGPFPLRTDTC